MAMERKIDLLLSAAALLVLGFLAAVYSNDLPLGVAGEWKWPRIRAWPSPASLMLASAGLLAYGGFAAVGYRALGGTSHPVERLRESGWVAGLVACAVAVQVGFAIGAPEGYGLTRWGVVHCFREATGYYDVAREHADDPWGFLADYPTWIEAQGPGHLGTHPPGLIALYSALLSLMERHDSVADRLVAAAPASIERGLLDVEFRQETTIPTPDRATLLLASLLTLFACAGTVAPLYLLARDSLSPRAAWASAAFWPLAPALNLFQPLSDAAYPLLSATALATAAWAARWRATPGASAWAAAAAAIASGLVMAFGMMFTLALLPIGVMVALVVLTTRSLAWPRRVALIAWIGAGFVVGVAAAWMATGADPLVVWWWNLRNNASFYEGGRRSYLTWLLVNPIELAIAAGLPAVVWGLGLAIGDRRAVPRAAWCGLAVVLIADLSGRNLGEVARLWMLFLPPLFTVAGACVARFGGGGQAIFVTVLLMGIQTLGLQCLTQVVYPP
ncbi:hypothetical protein [Paludisphaera soli]|uniref:hypothetical protein n=1 Tax=Paludisphaera soli TaxID=2712865 RepID=UPI0013EAB718|nr:hypothetical protein [Paludisphaera soli]